MADLIVHSIPGSPYGRSVFMALEEKGAPYRLAPVIPGQHRMAEHLARHPFGRIPAFEHDGFRLYETQAILRYIDRVIAGPSLMPSGPQAPARMDQLMNVNDWYLFQGVGNVIGFQRVVGPRLRGLIPDEAAIAAAMPQAHTVFNELAALLGDQAFFVGDTLSLADIHLAPQLEFMHQTPEWEPLTANHPNLRDWMARVSARPSMVATTWEKVSAMASAKADA